MRRNLYDRDFASEGLVTRLTGRNYADYLPIIWLSSLEATTKKNTWLLLLSSSSQKLDREKEMNFSQISRDKPSLTTARTGSTRVAWSFQIRLDATGNISVARLSRIETAVGPFWVVDNLRGRSVSELFPRSCHRLWIRSSRLEKRLTNSVSAVSTNSRTKQATTAAAKVRKDR